MTRLLEHVIERKLPNSQMNSIGRITMQRERGVSAIQHRIIVVKGAEVLATRVMLSIAITSFVGERSSGICSNRSKTKTRSGSCASCP